MQRTESVPSILESEATGKVAEIYADIRQVLGTSIVNLIWRNLATIPDALGWTWSAARQLYLGPAPGYAEAVRRAIDLPAVPSFSSDELAAAGLSNDDLAKIRSILDSYHHTNALALVVLSALVMHYEPTQQDAVSPSDGAPRPLAVKLPELPPMQSLKPEVVHLIEELNGFGEDTDKSLIASMYRHLGYWPTYLSLVRTMLVPLETDGQLHALTRNPCSDEDTWPRARSTPQAIHSSRHTPASACCLPSLCRPSYFTHDWNLFIDPHGDGQYARHLSWRRA